MFTDTEGGWLRKSNFTRKVYDPIRKKAGLPALPFHGLRHFHASYQVEIGTSIKVLQERLGQIHDHHRESVVRYGGEKMFVDGPRLVKSSQTFERESAFGLAGRPLVRRTGKDRRSSGT